MKNKTIIGTIAGGIVFFLLGFIIYGVLLKNYMEESMNRDIMRSMDEFIWWALILSNFIWAYFISMIFEWANINGMKNGAMKAALLGAVSSLAIDIGLYSNTLLYSDLISLFVDVVAVTVMCLVVGGVIGWIRASKGSES